MARRFVVSAISVLALYSLNACKSNRSRIKYIDPMTCGYDIIERQKIWLEEDTAEFLATTYAEMYYNKNWPAEVINKWDSSKHVLIKKAQHDIATKYSISDECLDSIIAEGIQMLYPSAYDSKKPK
jgi:hypothetical protein